MTFKIIEIWEGTEKGFFKTEKIRCYVLQDDKTGEVKPRSIIIPLDAIQIKNLNSREVK